MLTTARQHGATAAQAFESLLRRAAEAAEAGAEALCMADHLDYPPGGNNLECLTVTAMLVERIPKIEVVPLVLSAPLRPPGLLASVVETMEAAAPGRLRVGVGAGVDASEHRDAGATFGSARERVTAVRQACAAITRRCPSVPLIVAGGGARMLRIAAELADEWNRGMMLAHRRAELLDDFTQACARSGRTVRRSVLAAVLGGPAPDGEMARRYNLHLALRGRTVQELAEELNAMAVAGFHAAYLAPRSSQAWDRTLQYLRERA
jgi:alkanesulfonate monooxygenase SsuD/methylene tetrahydromethanopterin reductase-like flavin-dependent oxidoreductase (luciferase family)